MELVTVYIHGYWDGWMKGADNRILNDESIGENR